MKKCTLCETEKSLENFYPTKTGKYGRASWCKPCFRKRNNTKYKEKYQEYRQAARQNYKKRKQAIYYKIFEYLKSHLCVDCGESNPIVLEFDHRDRSLKSGGISQLVKFSWKRVYAEIQKCDVRCANCHRIRTAKQLNYYQDEIQPYTGVKNV